MIFTGLVLLAADQILSRKTLMTRLIAIALLAALAFPGCARKDGPEVAFLLSTLQEERYQKDVKYFEARANELGLRVVTLAADNDNAKQISQVEDVLAQGVKVLVIQPTDSQAASSYVRSPTSTARRSPRTTARSCRPISTITSRTISYKVGVLQAKAAIAATNGKGKYVILSGQAGHSVAMEITRGYEETLAPYIAKGDIEIVMKQNHASWSPEQSLRTVEEALTRTGNHVDAILANNSGWPAARSRPSRPPGSSTCSRRRRCRRREHQLRVPGQTDDRGPEGHRAARAHRRRGRARPPPQRATTTAATTSIAGKQSRWPPYASR